MGKIGIEQVTTVGGLGAVTGGREPRDPDPEWHQVMAF